MIRALTRYGALSAKVRAMYGKRLHSSDFTHIAACKDLSQVLDFLHTLPGWEGAVTELSSADVRRASLEAALRNHIRREYLRLDAFIPREDKLITVFPILQVEMEAIMTALRRLQSGHLFEEGAFPSDFLIYSKLDHEGLHRCKDLGGLVAATRETLFFPPLHQLLEQTPPGQLPDYTATEALLHATYFGFLYRQTNRQYTGETQKVLLRGLGEQVDLMNIIHILRLKKYFPGHDIFLTVLFPFNYKLKPAMVQALCTAPDLAAAFALLQDTPYAEHFSALDVSEVEDYYRRAFYQFNRKQLILGAPSIYCAIAYLNLRDLELDALVNAIECVKYGAPYDHSFTALLDA